MSYTVEEVRVAAKRELFRAGPRMRFVMPRISVPITTWMLNRDLSITPNQITAISAALGVGAGLLLIFPSSILAAVAAFFVYQLHILTDYIDGEIARVRNLASSTGAYYDLMVGRLTKPVVLYSAAAGTFLLHSTSPLAEIDLVLGAIIVFGFLLDKEAVDVWYRSNVGRTDVEDTYVVSSEHAVKGPKRVITRVFVGSRSIPAFLVYQIIASIAIAAGVDRLFSIGSYEVTPRSLILIWFAITFPALAFARGFYIARTGHIPRRQDLVRED